MWDERTRRVALRWGLLGLGLLAFGVIRVLLVFLQELADFIVRTGTTRLLASRMSQLKPLAFKWSALSFYGVVFAVLALGSLAYLVVLGLRDAWRDDPPSD